MNSFLVEAIDLRKHPIKNAKKKTRVEYFKVLSYIVDTTVRQANKKITVHSQTENLTKVLEMVLVKKYIHERLKLYRTQLLCDENLIVQSDFFNQMIDSHQMGDFHQMSDSHIVMPPMNKLRKRKYRWMLLCDVALVLSDKQLVMQAVEIMNPFLSGRRKREVQCILDYIFRGREIRDKHLVIAPFIKQYHLNQAFASQQERRIIVTANVSAGKSTLINALIGKPLAHTSQEVCTGNICYLKNKAFEDGNVHLADKSLTLMATTEEIHSYKWTDSILIASYFAGVESKIQRLCLIDTPGVDAALYKKHTKITHDALLRDDYDMLLYILSPTNLGTDAETKHLRWVAQNLSKEKIVFVLNKLDNYRDPDDSIEESVQGLKKDLLKIGFNNPVICPVSAYFSYLLKLKMTGQELSEDETDEYARLSKKFMRSSHDLSRYYDGVQSAEDETEEVKLSKRAGMYGLEKIIYGG